MMVIIQQIHNSIKNMYQEGGKMKAGWCFLYRLDFVSLVPAPVQKTARKLNSAHLKFHCNKSREQAERV